MEHEYCSQVLRDDLDEQDELEEINVSKGSDELLIDAVRGYPHLYNSSLKEYKDVQMKENLWNEIASLMDMSIAACQNRWLRLRERFTKEQRLRETETRSGSGVSHRSKFPLYDNMLFLGNHIKRRKSYTNINNVPVKKAAVHVSHVPSDRQYGVHTQMQAHEITCNTRDDAHNSSKMHSPKVSHSDSDIVPEQLQIRSQTNFSCSPYMQKVHSLQTQKNLIANPRTIQDTNVLQLKENPQNPICSSRKVNRLETESDVLSLSSSVQQSSSSYNVNEASKSSTLKNVTSALQKESDNQTESNIRQYQRNSGNIKRSSTYLESSLAGLSDALQNRLANQPSTEPDMWFSNKNLTPERSFGLLVATQLEAMPAPEKSKRKLAIAEILWKSL